MAQDQVMAEEAERKAYRAETLALAHDGIIQGYDITRFLAKALIPREVGGGALFTDGELAGLGYILKYCGEKLLPAMEALSESIGEVRRG